MLNVPAAWRIPPSFLDLSPFGAGEYGRPLRIIVDDETVKGSTATDLLLAFGSRAGLEILRTSKTAPVRIAFGAEIPGRDALAVDYVAGDGSRSMALASMGGWRDHARTAADEYGLDEDEALRGLLLAQASRVHQIDALISASPVLATPMWTRFAREAGWMSAEQACSLTGLFLRAHHDYTVVVEGNASTFVGFDDYYRGAAIASLPGYVNLLGTAVAQLRRGEGAGVFRLARAVEGRLGRALIARDYMNVRVRHWRPDEVWGDALYFFESFLLSLRGALDALARALHLLVGLPAERAKWAALHQRKWRRQAAGDRGGRLAAVLADDAVFVRAVEAVSGLRNYIHGELLSQEHVADDSLSFVDHGKGVLVISPDRDADLARTLLALDPEQWGINETHDQMVLVMPLMFMRAAVRDIWMGIAELLEADHLQAYMTAAPEPFDPRFWIPGFEHRENLMLLTGLPHPSRHDRE